MLSINCQGDRISVKKGNIVLHADWNDTCIPVSFRFIVCRMSEWCFFFFWLLAFVVCAFRSFLSFDSLF